MISHVKFVSIPTTDQDRAVAFWTERVGFRADRGVEFLAPPTKQRWGTFATFTDPDGNQFVLSSR